MWRKMSQIRTLHNLVSLNLKTMKWVLPNIHVVTFGSVAFVVIIEDLPFKLVVALKQGLFQGFCKIRGSLGQGKESPNF